MRPAVFWTVSWSISMLATTKKALSDKSVEKVDECKVRTWKPCDEVRDNEGSVHGGSQGGTATERSVLEDWSNRVSRGVRERGQPLIIESLYFFA